MSEETMAGNIDQIGYELVITDNGNHEAEQQKAYARRKRKLWTAIAFSVPAFYEFQHVHQER
ncbi:MAG: hypothetical protein U5L09_19005 [Bacteroidales bacterium]|nr:hypothetical protein [Bacteroidales bacterium]